MKVYPDIFFTEEYQQLFKDTEFGGIPCQFNYDGIDYRFYKRPIPGTKYFDIVSPYGYSGPVDISGSLYLNSGGITFLNYFYEYCDDNNIIAEFIRLHPFINDKVNAHYEHDIYYIDLTQSESEIWKGFDKGCKSAIKKAERNLWLSLDTEFRLWWEKMYYITMRKHSADNYQFNHAFWVKLFQTCSPKLFGIHDGENMLSASIILKHEDYCHYFLAAGGNQNYLLSEAIKWAKDQGCKIFNLGGGLKAGDSLESFKKSFTKTSKPFFTYRKIHNVEVYNKLCQEKGIDPNSEGYFPNYRR
jgi:hypothetical protein